MKNSFRPAIKLITILCIVLIAIAALFPPKYAYAISDANSDNLLPGDLNGDGQVDILDFILLKLIILGQAPSSDIADIDGNGKINLLDLTALLDYVFGKTSSIGRGGGGGGGGGGGAAVTNRVYFDSTQYNSRYGPAEAGASFTARVNTARINNLYEGTFNVSYDPAILQVSDVTDGEFAGNIVPMEGNWSDAGGMLTITVDLSGYAADGYGISGNGYLCDIHFQTIGSGTTPLAIDGVLEQMRAEELSEITGMLWINSAVNVTQWYNLTAGSSANGVVTAPGEGDFEYPEGQLVTITAASTDPCWDFVNWTGDTGTIANPNSASTTITMNGDYSITANFAIKQFTLTLQADPVAGGDPYYDGTGTYDCGEVVNIYADPDPCYNFVNWTGTAVDDGKVADPEAANTTVTMDDSYTLTANYAQIQYTLTIGSADNGTTTPGAGAHEYGCGSDATVTAHPDICYVLDYWASSNPAINGSTDNPLVINMVADYDVAPVFVISDTFTLTLQADPIAGGDPYYDGTGTYDCGDVVNIYADPDPCYEFVEWTGTAVDDGKVADPNAADTTVIMHSNYTLTANYEIKTFTLTTNVLPAEAADAGATVSGAGTYNCSESAPIQAYPAGSYSFAYWTSDDPAINGSTNISESVLMDSDKSVTANFVINPNTVYFQSIGNQSVGNDFSIQVMIYDTSYLALGTFDIRYNSSILSFVSLTNSVSAIGDGTGTTTQNTKGGNLFQIDVDYTGYAGSHSGNGVSGSGYLCTLTFSPLAPGTSPLYFVAGEGPPEYPAGELSLIKWIDYDDSPITPVYWIDGSITVQ
ncbi:MAG: cohesin domain-containing protein [Dehalococcoidia bacterium]|jgi:hypothetical protein